MAKRFLSIGECMVELAATAEGTFRLGFAGDTFNTAWHVRRALGSDWSVEFFTAVGDDRFSADMLAFMEGQNVSTRHIRKVKGKAPGLYVISLSNGERSFTYWRDSSAARDLAEDETALSVAVSGAEAIYFSGITLAILPPEGRERLLTQLTIARARGAFVAFDSNIRLRLWSSRDELRAAIAAAAKVTTLALPSFPDEAEVTGEKDCEAIAERYLAAGASEVVVKAGSNPAFAVWPGEEGYVEAVKNVVPVDTTGAGDAFNGAYIAARLAGDKPREAAFKAHITAARVIQAYGALA